METFCGGVYVVKIAVSADSRFRIALTKATIAEKWSGQSHSNFLQSCKRFVSSHLHENLFADIWLVFTCTVTYSLCLGYYR